MKHIITLTLAFLICFSINAEVRIHMEKESGVYKVPCTVNGLKMKFIFDTGAAKVCISSAYAEMMLENGYLDKSDIKGTSKSTIADGRVIDNVVINLRKVEIAGLTIENVPAVVVPTQNAPLLLGQSVIQKLGRVSIDGEDLVIHNANIYTEDEIDVILKKADDMYDNKVFSEALNYYKIAYDFAGEDTNPWILFYMGICYKNLDDIDSSIKCHLKAVELDDGMNDDNILYDAYNKLCGLFFLKEDYFKSLEYARLKLKYAINDSERAESYYDLGSNYCQLNNFTEGLSYSNKAINTYNSIIKKRSLDTGEAWLYCLSYQDKGNSLEELYRYDEAIETYSLGKKILEKYKNEEFYQGLINSFNEALSSCYKKLVK
ncbi:MAG: retroviral-like aspartic protease family protein [Muribaculaceae bacterium]|nr:retroviral-like aspartic protease family protein [Muribaculaceae bacterium]